MSNHTIETNDRNITVIIQRESCIYCELFDEHNEICKKYGSRPPARVIAIDGCMNFVPIIPF